MNETILFNLKYPIENNDCAKSNMKGTFLAYSTNHSIEVLDMRQYPFRTHTIYTFETKDFVNNLYSYYENIHFDWSGTKFVAIIPEKKHKSKNHKCHILLFTFQNEHWYQECLTVHPNYRQSGQFYHHIIFSHHGKWILFQTLHHLFIWSCELHQWITHLYNTNNNDDDENFYHIQFSNDDSYLLVSFRYKLYFIPTHTICITAEDMKIHEQLKKPKKPLLYQQHLQNLIDTTTFRFESTLADFYDSKHFDIFYYDQFGHYTLAKVKAKDVEQMKSQTIGDATLYLSSFSYPLVPCTNNNNSYPLVPCTNNNNNNGVLYHVLSCKTGAIIDLIRVTSLFTFDLPSMVFQTHNKMWMDTTSRSMIYSVDLFDARYMESNKTLGQYNFTHYKEICMPNKEIQYVQQHFEHNGLYGFCHIWYPFQLYTLLQVWQYYVKQSSSLYTIFEPRLIDLVSTY